MEEILTARRTQSQERLKEFVSKLNRAEEIAGDKACVYATGSFGRSEASWHSDLDLFIVGRGTEEQRELKNLKEICLKAELIDATRQLGIPEFSGDGEYLIHYTIDEIVKTTGKPEDDLNNTFTARLLLLLESRALIGQNVYTDAINEVISKYWGDYEDHKNEFVPGFLANDILRLWRTFCVNYEARTAREPEGKRNKRRLKNYKLKYSRLLTCYSALLYFLGVFHGNGTVSPDDAGAMVKLSPTERLEWILQLRHLSQGHDKTNELLKQYGEFLMGTDESEAELLERFKDPATRRARFAAANAFGDTMFELVELLGQKSRLHRLLVV